MNKRLIACAGLVIIVLVIAPVMAASPIDQILVTVKDIQTKVGTLLADLAAVQADVTTIQTTTSTINDKLDTPPIPTWYEYFSAPSPSRSPPAHTNLELTLTSIMEVDTKACVAWCYNVDGDQFECTSYTCHVIAPNSKYKTNYITGSVPIYVAFMTNSDGVIPHLKITIDGEDIATYLPGDFQKIEHYASSMPWY